MSKGEKSGATGADRPTQFNYSYSIVMDKTTKVVSAEKFFLSIILWIKIN